MEIIHNNEEEIVLVKVLLPIRLLDGSRIWEKICYRPLDFLCEVPQRENCASCLRTAKFFQETSSSVPRYLPWGCLEALRKLHETVRQMVGIVVARYAARERSKNFRQG
jgi:hypothetical protein